MAAPQSRNKFFLSANFLFNISVSAYFVLNFISMPNVGQPKKFKNLKIS